VFYGAWACAPFLAGREAAVPSRPLLSPGRREREGVFGMRGYILPAL
jgi:hypothetical protein